MARTAKNPVLRTPADDETDDDLLLDADLELDAMVAQARSQGRDDRSYSLSSDDIG